MTTTTAFELSKFCLDDTIPDCPAICEDYGFSRCRNEFDYSYLLGVYKTLIRFVGFNTHDMHVARIQGKLFDYISDLYERHDAANFYYTWLRRRRELVDSNISVMLPRK